jgi:hypothetical protein
MAANRSQGMHWPDLDEDVSVENLLQQASGESQQSDRLAAHIRT